jgi:hypothetical protein
MDESRIIVPWETIEGYLKVGEANRRLTPPSETLGSYTTPSVSEGLEDFKVDWITEGHLWALAREGCHPESAARAVDVVSDFSKPIPPFLQYTEHLRQGYVSNWTQAKDPCFQPHLQTLHGTFIEPISMSTTKQLIPLFGGSKFPMNNEILIPAAMYWKDFSEGKVYSSGAAHDPPWQNKEDKIVWRGIASGGRNRENTWPHFHRHRFVSMVNGTSVKLAEIHSSDTPLDFQLPPRDVYPLKSEMDHALGDWVSSFSDTAFLDLACFPPEEGPGCSYTNKYFSTRSRMDFKLMFNAKYLPDIDGNSFSGRYLAFLRSASLPIKATIYSEWHDSRLVAWRHFVPMDNTFIDVYGIMDYFLGYRGLDGRDEVARKIAAQGKEWAERVLRKEDMLIYTHRLLLEYARICDDQREMLGFVADLR